MKPWELASEKQIHVVLNKCFRFCSGENPTENKMRWEMFEATLRNKLSKETASKIIDMTGVDMFNNRKVLENSDEIKLILKENNLCPIQ